MEIDDCCEYVNLPVLQLYVRSGVSGQIPLIGLVSVNHSTAVSHPICRNWTGPDLELDNMDYCCVCT